MNKQKTSKLLATLFFILITLVFSSCGGGGGGGGGSSTVIVDGESISSAANFILRAEAGAGQSVAVGDLVVLNGSKSTVPKGKLITYQWFLDAVPRNSNADLSDNSVVNPTFIASTPGEYKVRLIVNDGATNSEADDVIITAAIGNRFPVSIAGGTKSAQTNEALVLDGSDSYDPDGDRINFQWTLTSVPKNSAVQLIGENSAFPSFTPDVDGAYIVALVVDDGDLFSVKSSTTIISSSGNSSPTSDAGIDMEILTGSSVTLDGTRSYDINQLDELSYSWFFTSVPNGSTAALSNPTLVNPSFTSNVSGAYVVSLVVNDGQKDSIVDSVTIVASEENTIPIAVTDQEVRTSIGSTLILDAGKSKDDDGDPLSYNWSLLDTPLGSEAFIEDSTSKKAIFKADVSGEYLLSLRVFDGKEFSEAQYVELTALDSVVQSSAIFTENFENGLGYWSVSNGIWEVGEPTSGPGTAYLDQNVAGTVLDGNYPESTDSRIVSPSIVLPEIQLDEELHLRFWHWFSISSCITYAGEKEIDYGYVQIATQTSPGVWSGWSTIRTYQGISGTWTNSSTDFSQYAGKKIRVGFTLGNDDYRSKNYNPNSTYSRCTSVSSGWYFDEIVIEKIIL